MTRRVVWILGAGFSMPLGGPSLASLLSFETERSLELEIPNDADHTVARENVLGRIARCTRWLYHYGTRFAANNGKCPLNGSGGETLWYDAEDFFDKLDRAARLPQGANAARLAAAIRAGAHGMNVPIPAVRDAAKRMLAFECSRFLDGQSTGDEPWIPYVRWTRQVKAQAEGGAQTAQAIITFNYDCVLETLGFQPHVVLPGSGPERTGPHVFKLHGSSNWRHMSPAYGDSNDTTPAVTVENDAVELAERKDFTATCDRSELTIAAPGLGKQYQALRFKELWELAGNALKTAGAVVFLGYRLPPTDARSRRFLLDNLPPGRIPIHVILGHDTNTPDARRMKGLLQMARPQAAIEVLPMFGQDYLDAYDPDGWDKFVSYCQPS